MTPKKTISVLAVVGALTAFAAISSHAATLDKVKAADTLKCGVNPGLPGFSFTDDAGNWTGFEEAYCRALAAAVLGDADKVSFVPLTGKNRFPALAAGEVDICRATRPGRFRATSISASPSSASTTMTARASSAARRSA